MHYVPFYNKQFSERILRLKYRFHVFVGPQPIMHLTKLHFERKAQVNEVFES